MKKIFATIITFCGLWAGTHATQMNSSAAQTIARTIIPLTNQAPFISTVMPATNLNTIQLSNVVTLLLTLQTNIEETIPVLDLLQSNAIVVSVMPTNGLREVAPPLTNSVTPDLPAAGSLRAQTSLAVKIGTNEFGIDAPTLLALFRLRNNLQQSLTTLQALNGTAPTSSVPAAPALSPPPRNFPATAVTNFSPGPLTNSLRFPLTNMPQFGGPSAF